MFGIVENGKIVESGFDLRERFRGTAWPKDLNLVKDADLPAGVVRITVLSGEIPKFQRQVGTKFTLRSGKWYQERVIENWTSKEVADALKAQAAEKRHALENAGISLPNGATVGTAVDDQNRISVALNNWDLVGVAKVDFKAKNGWINVTKPDLEAIVKLIGKRLQELFTAERAHCEEIDRLLRAPEAYGNLVQDDTSTGWPA